MNNCLVSKIPATFGNEVPKVGSFLFKLVVPTSTAFKLIAVERSDSMTSKLNVIEGNDIDKINGSTAPAAQKRSAYINTNNTSFELTAGTYILEITNKYNLSYFSRNYNVSPERKDISLYILGDSLSYMSSLQGYDYISLFAVDFPLALLKDCESVGSVGIGKGSRGNLMDLSSLQLTSIYSSMSSGPVVAIEGDLGDLPTINSFKNIDTNFCDIDISLDKLSGTTLLTQFNCAHNPSVKGSIANLVGNLGLTRMNVQYSDIEGDLSAFANTGRTSGNIRISGRDTYLTWQGSLLPTSDVYINFKSDQSITVTSSPE